jgi:uncharacterized membrane protein YphA (DoxX/SURF4 family)
MKTMKWFAWLGTVILLPFFAQAHVKWFVDTQEILAKYQEPIFYSWTSQEVIIWGVITLVVVIAFAFLDSLIKTPKKLLKYGLEHEDGINRVAQIIFGSYLLSVSALWGIIFAPDIPVSGIETTILQFLQGILGLMFIVNIKPRIASWVTFLLFIAMSIATTPVFFLENLMVGALAFYFIVINSPKDSKIFLYFYKHGVEIVRIATGVSLITLGFTEKFLNPALSLEFLSVHHWNFMIGIFPWFTNELFVLSVGFTEMIFGILFIMGYLTRATTVFIAIFFAVSVTAMFVQFNLWEVEDLVVYAAAILFIFYGHGRTKFFHFSLPKPSQE